MKKIVVLFSILCASLTTAWSQTFIPSVGLVISSTNADQVPNRDFFGAYESVARAGFTFGAGFNFPVTNTLSFQPELRYIQKGVKLEAKLSTFFEGADFRVNADFHQRIDYLEVPLLAKFTFGEQTKLFFTAGPSISYGIGGKTKISATLTSNDPDDRLKYSATGKVKYDDDVRGRQDDQSGNLYLENRIDWGLQLGAKQSISI